MEPDRIPVIGLTGGIGSGKSEVARILRDEHGCLVVDSDELARRALRDDEVKATIRQWWGDEVFDDEGEVDRSHIASIVFNDTAQRARLEGLIHPRVEASRKEIFAAAPTSTPALVIDAPLLMEAGIDAQCDCVIFVDADARVRRDRVLRSRGWSEAELERREAAQIPLDLKRKRADSIVVNNGDLNALREQVQRAFKRCTSLRP